MRTENLTLLLTDIKGYTARTSQQTRRESQAWLLEHEALVLPVIEAFGGVRQKGIGDAILATFTSPTNAALASMAIQDRLFIYNRSVEEPNRVEVRAVLTMGEVRIQKGELLGEASATLGKLDKYAGAGEIVMTEALYLAMNKAEVPARELGLKQVEGLSEPVRLFRVSPLHEDSERSPYGGRALSQRKRLRPVDGDWIRELRKDPKTTLVRDLRALRPRGSKKRLVPIAVGVALLVTALALPRLFESKLRSVERLFDEGRHSEARTEVARYIEKHPARPGDAHYLRGRLALADGKKTHAAVSFQKAIEVDPETYQSHPRIYLAMAPLLAHEDCDVRSAAADTLGLLGDKRAKSLLEEAIQEERERSNFFSALFCRFESHAASALNRLE